MRALTAGSLRTLPLSLCTKMASGTPQARWRDSTQSGRVSTIERDAVLAGRRIPFRIVDRLAWRARAEICRANLSSGLSIAANHCGVARKITGALLRQLCGYWMAQRALREQRAGFDQRLDHRAIGIAILFAIARKNELAFETRRILRE